MDLIRLDWQKTVDDEFLPIVITYDEVTDMWSYYVGDNAGVADTHSELIEKIWKLVEEWNNE